MLDEIKGLLGITDDSKDFIIKFYIKSVTNEVLEHCNIKELNDKLENFVENKVLSIMRYELNDYKGVKAIAEGDTKIELAIEGNGKETTIYYLNDEDKKTLNSNFRRLKF